MTTTTDKKPETKAAKERREQGPVNAVSLIGNCAADATAVFADGRASRIRFRLAINVGLFADGREKPAEFYSAELIVMPPRDRNGEPTGDAPSKKVVEELAAQLTKGQRVRLTGKVEHWSLSSEQLDDLRDRLDLTDENKLDDATYRAAHYASTPHATAFWAGEDTSPQRGKLRPLTLLPPIGEASDNHDAQTGFVV